MIIVKVQVEAFCVAADKVDGTTRANALQPLLRQLGFEPNGSRAWEVPDAEVKHLPNRAAKLLERATRAEYGPAASFEEMIELRESVLAANGGQLAELEDELRAIRVMCGYPPRKWVLERTRRAQERFTTPLPAPTAEVPAT